MRLRSYLSSRASAANYWSGTGRGHNSQVSSKPIKVLHIINDLSVGGAEITLYKLLSEMDEERFSFAVVSLKNRGKLRERIEALGVPVYTARMSHAVPTPASIWRLIRLVRRLKPDVIQGWMSHGNLASQLTAAFTRGRATVLWNIRQSLYSLDYEKRITAMAIKLGARISTKPTGIIYNSRIGAAQHAAIGYSLEKALVIHNGFDTNIFTPSRVARHSVRSELGVAQNTDLIGLMGRYHELKDHPNFLRAAALLREKNPDVQFVLAGREINWDNQSLRELIQELGLVERVHLLGERQDMPRLTAALDVAVSASFGEGFPNVIGEAMACGVPCVVTDVSDLPWIVGGTGRVVPPRDPAAMAQAFVEMIELGIDGREELGSAARARVMEHFCLDSVVAQYEALYENAAARKEIGRFIRDVRYRRFPERVPSNTLRKEAITGASNGRPSRSSKPKW
jgi:glycosyltransferase involved in cell wall biosynthesis